jgi:hypothetical protein
MCSTNQKSGCSRNVQGEPEKCSEELIRECHGEDNQHPCVSHGDCAHPEELVSSAKECTSEQIRQCHGDGGHSCK